MEARNAPLSVRLDGLCLGSERLVDELWRVRCSRWLSEPAKALRMEQTIATFLGACRLEELRAVRDREACGVAA
jgi:hypothetical protein